jgi:DNA-binding PucR family transcriptional regulator
MKPSHCYYLRSIQSIQEKTFRPLLEDVLGQKIAIQVLTKTLVVFQTNQDHDADLQTFLDTYQQEFNVKFHALKTYRVHAMGEFASQLALKTNPGKVDTLADFLLQTMLEGNRSFVRYIYEEFQLVPRHLMQTAATLISCDMKATTASKKLYIHRNTFAYRLNQFIDLTGLDIRLHDHALFFTLVQKALMMHR